LSIGYVHNLNRKMTNTAVFENVMGKNTKCLTTVIYHAIYSKHRRPKIFGEWDIFWLKSSGFAKEASFDPKKAISAMKLKLHVTTLL